MLFNNKKDDKGAQETADIKQAATPSPSETPTSEPPAMGSEQDQSFVNPFAKGGPQEATAPPSFQDTPPATEMPRKRGLV